MPVPTLQDASPALLTLAEAGRYLRVGERTMRTYVSQRRLRFYKPAGQLLFDPADLDAFVRAAVVEPVSQ